jgi:hypothetical protein
MVTDDRRRPARAAPPRRTGLHVRTGEPRPGIRGHRARSSRRAAGHVPDAPAAVRPRALGRGGRGGGWGAGERRRPRARRSAAGGDLGRGRRTPRSASHPAGRPFGPERAGHAAVPGPALAARTWVGAQDARSLLSSVARDAIDVLGGSRAARLKRCEGSRCALLFVDTSRSGRRRWCSMERCGNRAKVAAHRRRRKENDS